jgi:hypothetical protein
MLRSNSAIAVIWLVAAVASCNRGPDIDELPAGTEVQVTREDGGLVEGKLQQVSEESVKVDTGRVARVVPKAEIADVRVVSDLIDDEPPAKARFREVLVPADTTVDIKLETAVSSETSDAEDVVGGRIASPVVVEGQTVIPTDSPVRGVISHAQAAGKVKGRASLGLRFEELVVDGVMYPIAASFSRTAPSEATNDAKKIGIPAIGGAVVGGILGGKKGAAIGAAAGGGAGAAVVLTQAGKPVAIEESTVLSLKLGRDVDVRVPVH